MHFVSSTLIFLVVAASSAGAVVSSAASASVTDAPPYNVSTFYMDPSVTPSNLGRTVSFTIGDMYYLISGSSNFFNSRPGQLRAVNLTSGQELYNTSIPGTYDSDPWIVRATSDGYVAVLYKYNRNNPSSVHGVNPQGEVIYKYTVQDGAVMSVAPKVFNSTTLVLYTQGSPLWQALDMRTGEQESTPPWWLSQITSFYSPTQVVLQTLVSGTNTSRDPGLFDVTIFDVVENKAIVEVKNVSTQTSYLGKDALVPELHYFVNTSQRWPVQPVSLLLVTPKSGGSAGWKTHVMKANLSSPFLKQMNSNYYSRVPPAVSLDGTEMTVIGTTHLYVLDTMTGKVKRKTRFYHPEQGNNCGSVFVPIPGDVVNGTNVLTAWMGAGGIQHDGNFSVFTYPGAELKTFRVSTLGWTRLHQGTGQLTIQHLPKSDLVVGQHKQHLAMRSASTGALVFTHYDVVDFSHMPERREFVLLRAPSSQRDEYSIEVYRY